MRGLTNRIGTWALSAVLIGSVGVLSAQADSVVSRSESPSGASVKTASADRIAARQGLLPVVDEGPAQIDANGLARAYEDQGEWIDVIVTLKKPAQTVGLNLGNPPELNYLEDLVEAVDARTLARLSNSNFRLGYRYQTFGGFSCSITLDGLEALLKDPAVQSVMPSRLIKPHGRQGIPLMNALKYRSEYAGQQMAIAVADEGVDYNHPLLGGPGFPNSKVLGGYDFVDNDPDPIPEGDGAHGTAVAGIAAGMMQETRDYIGGVAPEAKIYALRVLGEYGGIDAWILASMDWCVINKNRNPNYPILVANYSLGSSFKYDSPADCDRDNPAYVAAAQNMRSAGIMMLASSGNDGYCDGMGAPACVSNIVSVGAVFDAAFGDFTAGLMGASCLSPVYDSLTTMTQYMMFPYVDHSMANKVISYSNSAYFLDLLAPSQNAFTLDITGERGYAHDGFAPHFNGTSASCPYAAGAAAAVQSAAKDLTGNFLKPADLLKVLKNTGAPIVDAKARSVIKPRVDVGLAIESFMETLPPEPTPGTPWRAYYDVTYKRFGRKDTDNIRIDDEGIFLGEGGGPRDTLKIKNLYPKVEDIPAIPLILVPMGIKKIQTDGVVNRLIVSGHLDALKAKNGHVQQLEATSIGSVAMADTVMGGTQEEEANAIILCSADTQDGIGSLKLKIKMSGVNLLELRAPAQGVDISLASKKFKNALGQKDVSLSGVPQGGTNSIWAGSLERLLVKGAGIQADLISDEGLLRAPTAIETRGSVFTVGSRDEKVKIHIPGHVDVGTLESQSPRLSVEASGGDIRANQIRAAAQIDTLSAKTKALPWKVQEDFQVFKAFDGGFIVVGRIQTGVVFDPDATAPGPPNIMQIVADWGLNWDFDESTGTGLFHRNNQVIAGSDGEGMIREITSMHFAERTKPYEVWKAGGPFICGSAYSATQPPVRGGLFDGYFTWSDVYP